MWKILEQYEQDHRRVSKIQHSCGHTKIIRSTSINQEQKCKRCMLTLRNKSMNHRGINKLTKTFYNYFKNVAKRREIEFNVTIGYLSELAEGQNYKCSLTGLKIDFPTKSDGNGNSIKTVNCASLDRIDSSKGYVEGNVQWVHKSVNIMKNGFSQEEFIYFCHLVSQLHANPEPSSLKGNRKVREKVQRLMGEDIRPIIPTRVPNTLN